MIIIDLFELPSGYYVMQKETEEMHYAHVLNGQLWLRTTDRGAQ